MLRDGFGFTGFYLIRNIVTHITFKCGEQILIVITQNVPT